MIKVTVAIPVYNAGEHLIATLESLINQTLAQEEFEIICVNDCSTDNSKEIIESYKRKMTNLILIDRTENSGGPMIPRNDAIEAAKGEFILFLDNDDYLGKETLERFYKMAVKNFSDVIFGKYVGVNGRKVPASMFKNGNRLDADILEDNLVFSMAPHKMFRTSFLRRNQIMFHPKAKIGEDQLFVMQCYIKANVITVLADYDYYYVVSRGDENLSLKYFPVEDFYFAPKSIMQAIEESDLNSSYKKELKLAFLHRLFKASRLRKYLFTNILTREQKIEWFQATKEFIDTYIGETLSNDIHVSHQYFVQLIKNEDLDTLIAVEKQLKDIKPEAITRVINGKVYARLSNAIEDFPYKGELVVNHLIKTDVYIQELSFTKTNFRVKGQFSMDLLKNIDRDYSLILKHRNTGTEHWFKSQENHLVDTFDFLINYQDIHLDSSLLGPWDLFVEVNAWGYVSRKRIGAKRSPSILAAKENLRIQTSGGFYNLKPYFTKNYDNISFDLKPSPSKWSSLKAKLEQFIR